MIEGIGAVQMLCSMRPAATSLRLALAPACDLRGMRAEQAHLAKHEWHVQEQ